MSQLADEDLRKLMARHLGGEIVEAHSMGELTEFARAVIEAEHKRLMGLAGEPVWIWAMAEDHAYTSDQLAAARLQDQQRIAELEAQISARKPLTDERLGFLVMEHIGPHALAGGKMSVYDAFCKAVRATEAAHEIKEGGAA